MLTKKRTLTSIAISLSLLISSTSNACTGVRLQSDDGSFVSGRTMEFSKDVIDYSIYYVPENTNFIGESKNQGQGYSWDSEYSFVSYFVKDLANEGYGIEGINEKGVSAGLFFFSPYKKGIYMPEKADESTTISGNQVISWILSNADDVEYIKEELPKLNVVMHNLDLPGWENTDVVSHYVAYDNKGGSIVIEYINGKLEITDNPLGAVTNNPEFSWHLENLTAYTSLPIDQIPPIRSTTENQKKIGLDVGSNKDIPGTLTSKDRFVRAALFSQVATGIENSDRTVNRVLNILNNFDIPYGYKKLSIGGPDVTQSAQWTSVTDITNQRFFFRTEDNPNLRMISLENLMNNKQIQKDIIEIKYNDEFSYNEINL